VQTDSQLTALLIAPDRELANQFMATIPQTRAFQVLADLKSYPPAQTMEIRLRQLKPHVVLLDLSSDLTAATDLIRIMAGLAPPAHVVGLHRSNDSAAILQSLRAGATEFLYAPFDLATQRDAIARLRRICAPEQQTQSEAGRVLAFSSSKPGSGASTLATQTAFALQRLTGKRILLADFDLTGGTTGFYLKLNHEYSLVDALQHAERLDANLWSSFAVNHGGLDILPSPAAPYAEAVDASRVRTLIEHARQLYDWVILDLPSVFNQTSLVAISEAEKAFVVSTAELPSLHLTRKAMTMVDQIGFPKDRFQVVINRADKHDDIGTANMEKLVNCPIYASVPNDYFSLHRAVTLGQPLGSEGELGKAVEQVAGKLCGLISSGKKQSAAAREMKPALSQA
jgi:pilus assembly protein CpaE